MNFLSFLTTHPTDISGISNLPSPRAATCMTKKKNKPSRWELLRCKLMHSTLWNIQTWHKKGKRNSLCRLNNAVDDRKHRQAMGSCHIWTPEVEQCSPETSHCICPNRSSACFYDIRWCAHMSESAQPLEQCTGKSNTPQYGAQSRPT